MKNGKWFAVCLGALAAVLGMAACSAPVPAGSPAPEGKGYVTLSIGPAAGGRTLLPQTFSFDSYDLEFTKSGGAKMSVPGKTNLNDPVELAAGSWTLALTAYIGGNEAAEGSAAFTLGSGESVNVSVDMSFPDLTGTGSLSYTITIPSGLPLSSARITLSPTSGTGEEITITGSLVGTRNNIPAGYYVLTVTLAGGGNAAILTGLVHIYDGQTTPVNWEFGPGDFHGADEDDLDDGPAVLIREAKGWLNAAYVGWDKLSGAESYNVYYRTGGGDYTRIDDPLIREYPDSFRADIPGLAAGSYELKVAPVLFGSEGSGTAQTTVTVESHDRSGFAFINNRVPGGYKMDGTPKDNARIIYLTEANKNTLSLSMKTASNKEETLTGLKAILDAFKKGYELRPLIVRVIGKITTLASMDDGDIVIDQSGKNENMYLTLEGVGDDATAYGWGIRIKNASNIEINNLGFMLTNSGQKDDVSLQTDAFYIWVHNCDLFYGNAGGDSDQAKGDGALDSKESGFVTFSYNHFWDTGKSNLLGNGTEAPQKLTYHHNWYDHSDSRHPRVRFHTVHVYNNYYDGISKYGIGAAKGGPSIFAEANYFLNSKNPMMISMQGTDIYGGEGTFSSETGGIIKAYNNTMVNSARYARWSASNTVEFDAYEVQNRNDTVPSTVKTKSGGFTYNNFDTAPDMYAYTPDTPEEARTKVIEYAGRYYGGDFKWTFTDADNTDSGVNSGLKSALSSYASALVAVQGGGGDSGDSGGSGNTGSGDIDGAIVCTFTGSGGPSNPAFTVNGTYSNSKGTATVNGTTYTECLKMESSTEISFSLSKPMTLTLVFAGTEGNKKVKIDDVNETTDASGKLTKALTAGSHTITKGDSINLFYISLSDEG
jgi:pectate lyase